MAAPLVLALGGSLLRPEETERHAWLSSLANLLSECEESIGIVVGGGVAARKAIELAKEMGEKDLAALDEIGIAATRVNATLVSQFLMDTGIDVFGGIPTDVTSASQALEDHSVVVMGGTRPGHTTDNVAIRLAIEANAARCLIATNVGYVYSSDPRADSEARPIESMTLSELQDIVGPPIHGKAGKSSVIDPIGVQAAIENNLPLAVLDGREMDRIADALAGKPFVGTRVEVG
ncbi:MAG: UMP kinase [Candidatus Thermoplasmatota archaeon]|nr:UMP kinase [Candidatus Thermoplasmatota archaeon]